MKCFSFPVHAFIHSTDACYALSSLSGAENVAVNWTEKSWPQGASNNSTPCPERGVAKVKGKKALPHTCSLFSQTGVYRVRFRSVFSSREPAMNSPHDVITHMGSINLLKGAAEDTQKMFKINKCIII